MRSIQSADPQAPRQLRAFSPQARLTTWSSQSGIFCVCLLGEKKSGRFLLPVSWVRNQPVFTCWGHGFTSQAEGSSSLLPGSASWPYAQRESLPVLLPHLCPLPAEEPFPRTGCQSGGPQPSSQILRKQCSSNGKLSQYLNRGMSVCFWEEEEGRQGEEGEKQSKYIE